MFSFSVDDDPSRVRSYMKERGYTFPVIVNKELELKLFPQEGSLPKIWVIGPDGRRAARCAPSNSFGRALFEIEKMENAN